MPRAGLAVLVLCATGWGCSRPDGAAPAAGSTAGAASGGAAAPASPPSPPKGSLLLGERVTAPVVPLTEIARSPARFENQTIATSGKVTAVCQAMGCWMEIQDASGLAHVRMHGHSFFVPKTAAGHMARVQARVVGGNAEECLDSPSPQPQVAKIELDATGVELD
jgi:hypothetical protein